MERRVNSCKQLQGDSQREDSNRNAKYCSPERYNNQIETNDLLHSKPLIKSYSQKKYTQQADSANHHTQTHAKATYANLNKSSNSNMLSDRDKKQNQNALLLKRGDNMELYINKQIQKKLSYCLNGSSSKEIYPSKIVSALKTEQNQNKTNPFILDPQILFQKQQEKGCLNSKQDGYHLDKRNQECRDFPKTKSRSISHQNIRLQSLQRSNNEIEDNGFHTHKDEEQKCSTNQSIKYKMPFFRNQNETNPWINKSIEHRKLNMQLLQNQNKDGQNNGDDYQSERRIKTDSSLQADYTTQTCPIRSKSPESVTSISSPFKYANLKQRSLSKKQIERIKMTRGQNNNNNNVNSSYSLYNTRTKFEDENSMFQNNLKAKEIQNHNQQMIQQTQRMHKYAEYIKLDTYNLNQELRPNKLKVQELVDSILSCYSFLLNLTPDKSRISKIMKECGATKGRLIEIFFVSPKQSFSPINEDYYYNKYLDTIEKSYSAFNDQTIIDDNQTQTNTTLFNDSSYTERTPTSYSDLQLVHPLIPKCFYVKTYFKVLQKDSNGVAYVQEYIDLQVIEDLDNLKTTLQFCLKMSEDVTVQRKEKSRSPTHHSPSNPVQKEKGMMNFQKSEECLFDVKMNKYELTREGVQIKNQNLRDNYSSNNVNPIHSTNNNKSKIKQAHQKREEQQNSNKQLHNIQTVNNEEVQQYLDLLKDNRTERQGIISDMRQFSSVQDRHYIQSYNKNVSDYIDYDISKYL